MYALHVSTVFEIKYPEKLVALYQYPWWRILLVLLIVVGYMWRPAIGVLVAIIVFFYLHDMYIESIKKYER
jgi:uncharacterized membrane protein YphA (DoxX/SURF4 family)